MSWSKNFDPDLLDPQQPFELDQRNEPHLANHVPFTAEDLLDVELDTAVWVRPDTLGRDEVLMIARIPGDVIVVVVVEADKPNQVRPITIFRAGLWQQEAFDRGNS